jgi:hypothetical protein
MDPVLSQPNSINSLTCNFINPTCVQILNVQPSLKGFRIKCVCAVYSLRRVLLVPHCRLFVSLIILIQEYIVTCYGCVSNK